MVINCTAMCSKHSFFVCLPLLLQLCTPLARSRNLKARQPEEPVPRILVLKDCCVLKDDSAPLAKEVQVVDSCFVYPFLLVLVLRLVVLQVGLSQSNEIMSHYKTSMLGMARSLLEAVRLVQTQWEGITSPSKEMHAQLYACNMVPLLVMT